MKNLRRLHWLPVVAYTSFMLGTSWFLPSSCLAWNARDGQLQVRASKIFNVTSFQVDGNESRAEIDIPELKNPSEFDQSLRFSMLGYVSPSIHADVRFDDTRSDRVEHVHLQGEGRNFRAELGDIRMDYTDASFLVHNRKVKGGRITSRLGDHEVGVIFSRLNGLATREIIEGDYTRGPFTLTHKDIISQSEIVKLDGETVRRNRDYTIDYSNGTVSFIDEVPGGVRIEVFYEYIPEDTSSLTRTIIGFDGSVGLGGSGGNLGLTVLRRKDQVPDGDGILDESAPSYQTLIDLRHDLSLTDRVRILSEVALSEADFNSLVSDASLRDEAARIEAEIDMNSVLLRLGTKQIGDDFLFMGGNTEQDCLSSKRFAIVDYVPGGPVEGSVSFAENDSSEKDIVGSVAWQVREPLTVYGRAHTRRRQGDTLKPDRISRGGNLRLMYVRPGCRAETTFDRFETQQAGDHNRISNNVGMVLDARLANALRGHLETSHRKDEQGGSLTGRSEDTSLSLKYRPHPRISFTNKLSLINEKEAIFAGAAAAGGSESNQGNTRKAADLSMTYRFDRSLVTTASLGKEVREQLSSQNTNSDSYRWGFDVKWTPYRFMNLLGKYKQSSQTGDSKTSSLKLTVKPSTWAKLSAEYGRNTQVGSGAPGETFGTGIDLRFTDRLRALAKFEVENSLGEVFKTREKGRLELKYRLRTGIEFSLNFRSEGMRNNASCEDNYTARIGSFNLSAEL